MHLLCKLPDQRAGSWLFGWLAGECCHCAFVLPLTPAGPAAPALPCPVAQVVQLFDSWAHHLSPEQFAEFSMPYSERIIAAVRPSWAACQPAQETADCPTTWPAGGQAAMCSARLLVVTPLACHRCLNAHSCAHMRSCYTLPAGARQVPARAAHLPRQRRRRQARAAGAEQRRRHWTGLGVHDGGRAASHRQQPHAAGTQGGCSGWQLEWSRSTVPMLCCSLPRTLQHGSLEVSGRPCCLAASHPALLPTQPLPSRAMWTPWCCLAARTRSARPSRAAWWRRGRGTTSSTWATA